MAFTTVIVGLGLMGGSLAFALKGFRGGVVIGFDTDAETSRQALSLGAVDRVADSLSEAVSGADLTVFCVAPSAILETIHGCLPFKSGAIVTEICGVKREIASRMMSVLPPDVSYIGLHPMAGKEVGGFVNADPKIFQGAGFIVVMPESMRDDRAIALISDLSVYVGAGRIIWNKVVEHDEIIAYTSDLMHIAAAALCSKIPSGMTLAHTAGAFRDCTRIANIDAALWTDLLTRNSEYVLPALRGYVEQLNVFADALACGERGVVQDFLARACANKKEMMTR